MDRTESVRWAVRRHRVRTRLLALLDGAAAVVPWLHPRVRPPRSRGAVAVALAAPIVAVSLAMLMPNVRDAARPAVVVPKTSPVPELSSTSVLLPSRLPAHDVRGAPVLLPRPSPSDRVRDLPGFQFDHSGPVGDGTIWGKPKDPDDHFVCVEDVVVVGDRCFDLPVKITG